MSQVLILGAGLVAGPLVDYLYKEKIAITLASHILSESQTLARSRDNINPISLNVSDAEALSNCVKQHKIVVSFIPFTLHPLVAKACLKNKVNLVTASYRSEEMAAFDEDAKSAGITILNEMGFDPGLDHLSAMSVIDKVQQQGGTVKTFVSWGSGLPAPECNDNPFGYKFAWSPISVLLAMKNEARFLNHGKVVTVSADNLLDSPIQAWTGEQEKFEGYPNRDSLPYQQAYGLQGIDTLMRGTLRYAGNLEIMRQARDIGLFDQARLLTEHNWLTLMARLTTIKEHDLPEKWAINQKVKQAFIWAGMFDERILIKADSAIQAFCELLEDKLVFKPDEYDMALLLHKFAYEDNQGDIHYCMSKLKVFGDKGGYSAMAKAVGTPAAIATKLLLDGKVSKTGSILPVAEEFYRQILPVLDAEGLSCQEDEIDSSNAGFLKETEAHNNLIQ